MQDKQFLAHIAEDGRKQTVDEHCKQAAQYSGESLADIGLPVTAYLCGLLHDLGKYTDAFQKYICRAANHESVSRGTINHTFAGVRYLLLKYHNSKDPYLTITAEIFAYAIGAHHGLFDCVDAEHKSGFDWRLHKEDPVIDEAIRNFSHSAHAKELEEKMSLASAEIKAVIDNINGNRDPDSRHFLYGLLTRLVLSAVIEGDRKDTAAFMQNRPIQEMPHTDWPAASRHLEEYLSALPGTNLSTVRSEISDRCKEAARLGSDLYRLNVPTGGGKTLSSLRFALHHAEIQKKRRIIYVIPLLTIIEQNAAVIRSAIGDSIPILEHHSNVVEDICDGEALAQQELLAEAWDAPILITTQVQFLNALFSHKTTAIRRFHSLTNSIIILDEVQTVPQNMLSLFNQALVFLREVCHATVILCSATQPCLEKAHRAIPFSPQELISCDEHLHSQFRRTNIQNCGAMTMEEIAIFAEDKLESCQSILLICNKKDQAAELYQKLSGGNTPCFHLSTNLCMQHRRDILKTVEAAKKQGKVILVSTQLIESGVDISFGCVIRFQAGMDSIVQAAGRCNRNGESSTPADVYVVSCIGENLSKLETIRMGKNATQSLFAIRNSEFDSDEAIAQYYQFLYRSQDEGYQEFFCKELHCKLFSLLGRNREYLRPDHYFLHQAFKTAGEHFSVFDDNSVDILVPYGKGESILADLRSAQVQFNLSYMKQKLNEAKPFSVSIFQYQKDALIKAHALEQLPCGVWVLEKAWYDSRSLGLLNEPQQDFWEV